MLENNNANTEKCFADKGMTCSALTTKQCHGCSFKKSVKQYREDRMKYKDKEMEYIRKHSPAHMQTYKF